MSEFTCKHCGSTREPIVASTPCPAGGVQLDKEDPQYAELGEFDFDGLIMIGMQACRDCHRIESFWVEDLSAPVRLDWGGAEFVGSPSWMSEWQPIETAPMDGSVIMLGNAYGAWIGQYVALYQSGYVPFDKWFSLMLNKNYMGSAYSPAPTHWMPLPEAPK